MEHFPYYLNPGPGEKKIKENTGAGPRQKGQEGHGNLVFDNGVIGAMYAPNAPNAFGRRPDAT